MCMRIFCGSSLFAFDEIAQNRGNKYIVKPIVEVVQHERTHVCANLNAPTNKGKD